MATERDVHLLLSQKAASSLSTAIVVSFNYGQGHLKNEDYTILEAIQSELVEQIEKPKKKKKSSASRRK